MYGSDGEERNDRLSPEVDGRRVEVAEQVAEREEEDASEDDDDCDAEDEAPTDKISCRPDQLGPDQLSHEPKSKISGIWALVKSPFVRRAFFMFIISSLISLLVQRSPMPSAQQQATSQPDFLPTPNDADTMLLQDSAASSTANCTMEINEIPVGAETMKFVRRSQWGARNAKHVLESFGDIPADYVIISQVCGSQPCTDGTVCCALLRNIQQYHMTEKEFDDIGFSYVIANDGVVYEGRGHEWRPATAKGWNSVAYGVAFMGQFNADSEHCQAALKAAQLLFRYLQAEGKLEQEFIVYGLRQVRPFDAPCDSLYNVIQTWPQWRPYGATDEETIY